MSNLEDVQILSRKFIASLGRRRGPSGIDLTDCRAGNWFHGAYYTIQRTLWGQFHPLSENQKAECRRVLWAGVPRLMVGTIDQELGILIEREAREFSLSIGHSQKLVSILGKYAFVVYHTAPQCLPPAWQRFVPNCARRLPVPIDTLVLYGLKDQHPQDFPDVLATRRINRKGAFFYTAKIRQGDGQWRPWSRIDDYDTYWSLQQRIRRLAGDSSPLEFEMRHLWVAD